MTTASCSNRLVTLIGATGTGKSQLAVSLAKRFNGEIINGDAMQLYEGVPIITNKIKMDDREGIPHHLLGGVSLNEHPWTASVFATEALRIIQDVRSRGRLPILVGGTHYYIQYLLFDAQEMSSGILGEHAESSATLTAEEVTRQHPILDASNEEILARLKEVDPIMADRWHPKDRRRLQRSLEIFLVTGTRASDIYSQLRNDRLIRAATPDPAQHKDNSMDRPFDMIQAHGLPALTLWIHARPELLRPRLDARVLTMLQNGLMSEVESLYDHLQVQEARGISIDRSRGIWVSIGFKEFEPYLAARKAGDKSPSDLESLKEEAIQRIQGATRQYARRQDRWIRIKFLHALMAAGKTDMIAVLDGSELNRWPQEVLQPANEIVDKYLAGAKLPTLSSDFTAAAKLLIPKRDRDLSKQPDLWMRRTCDICAVTTIVEEDWIKHIRGRGHRKAAKRKAKETGRPSIEGADRTIAHLKDQLEAASHEHESPP